MKGIDIALEIFKRKNFVFKNYRKIAEKIKKAAKEILRDENVRVIVFGSVVRKTQNPLSDLDVLIVSKKAEKVNYGKVVSKIKKEIGKNLIGIEFHLVTPSIFENWYKRFIDKYEEV